MSSVLQETEERRTWTHRGGGHVKTEPEFDVLPPELERPGATRRWKRQGGFSSRALGEMRALLTA